MIVARLTALVVLVAACSAAGLGCAGQGCSEVGCDDGVEVDITSLELGEGTTVGIRVCVESRCRERRAQVEARRSGRQSVYVGVDGMPDAGGADVRVAVTDAYGRTLVEREGRGFVTVTHPNGEDCPPECRAMLVRLEDLAAV